MKNIVLLLMGVIGLTSYSVAFSEDEVLESARKKIRVIASQKDSASLCAAIPTSSTEVRNAYSEVLSNRMQACLDGKIVTIIDERTKVLNESFVELLGKARSGKVSYLEAARAHQDNFFRLFPEYKSNAYVNEYLTYMAVQGELVDLKKVTETQAQYELAKKNTELIERAERAAQRQQVVAVSPQPVQAETRIEVVKPAQLPEPQPRTTGLFGFSPELKSALFNLGGMFLQQSHEQALARQNRMQHCVWTRLGNGWTQMCN